MFKKINVIPPQKTSTTIQERIEQALKDLVNPPSNQK